MLSERKQTTAVAICTERVEAKNVNPTWLFGYDVAICTERVEAKSCPTAKRKLDARCNLHGACGGKGALQFHPYY